MGWRGTGWLFGFALLFVIAWFDYTVDFWWTAGVALYVMTADSVLAAVAPRLTAPRRTLVRALGIAAAVVAEALTFVLAGHRAWELTIAVCGIYLLFATAGGSRRDRPQPAA
jgi:hypothetical protein